MGYLRRIRRAVNLRRCQRPTLPSNRSATGINLFFTMTTPSTTSSLPHQLSPFGLRGLPMYNRVVMAPLTRERTGRGLNDLMLEYYAQRASAGLIISEVTMVSEQANGCILPTPSGVSQCVTRSLSPLSSTANSPQPLPPVSNSLATASPMNFSTASRSGRAPRRG